RRSKRPRRLLRRRRRLFRPRAARTGFFFQIVSSVNPALFGGLDVEAAAAHATMAMRGDDPLF
ncbi:hypothetical protein, partial [Gluconacetobacter sacchari]|uniref:hypothetical protein n=1 Tax=Gluconacetobacter sacchari TaxID=92759 RepID=UPI0022305E8E